MYIVYEKSLITVLICDIKTISIHNVAKIADYGMSWTSTNPVLGHSSQSRLKMFTQYVFLANFPVLNALCQHFEG